MRKHLFLLAFLFLSKSAFAQFDDDDTSRFNKWSLELETGFSKAVRPFDSGYYVGYSNKLFEGLQINHYGLAIRYMLNEKFGFKSRLSIDNIHNYNNSPSQKFQLYYSQLSLEAVMNLIKICDLQEQAGRFGLLMHTGVHLSMLTPRTGYYKSQPETNLGVLIGLTPQFRITKRTSIYFDMVSNTNLSQQYTWNGTASAKNNNSVGTLYSASIGVSISLGRHKMHGDWTMTEKENNNLVIDTLKMRVSALEKSLKDGDNDGVPDYLDEEKNSLPGSYVDTHGRMLDQDSDGVPDYVENYITTSSVGNNIGNAPESSVMQMINDGYVAAYFDFAQANPSTNSTPDIGFICNYLKAHPERHVEIVGYTDRIGNESSNRKLSLARAENVKAMLMKAGIARARMTTKGAAVDYSIEKSNSEYSRRLARRVVFKVN